MGQRGPRPYPGTLTPREQDVLALVRDGLTNEQIADVLCKAAGHWGSGAEYLMQTVDQLERLGIRDANLWRLQRLVAQQLVGLRTTTQMGISYSVDLVD